MLTGLDLQKALDEAGIAKIQIVPWELDKGILGISIQWKGGQSSAFPVECIGPISERLIQKPKSPKKWQPPPNCPNPDLCSWRGCCGYEGTTVTCY